MRVAFTYTMAIFMHLSISFMPLAPQLTFAPLIIARKGDQIYLLFALGRKAFR